MTRRSLEWKVRVFTVGAALAMVGIYFDARWVTGTALVVLVGGVLLRFVPEGSERSDAAPAPSDAGDDVDP